VRLFGRVMAKCRQKLQGALCKIEHPAASNQKPPATFARKPRALTAGRSVARYSRPRAQDSTASKENAPPREAGHRYKEITNYAPQQATRFAAHLGRHQLLATTSGTNSP
jgi:hypothetical protein